MDRQRKKPQRLVYAMQQTAIDKEINRLQKKAESLRARRRQPTIAVIVQTMLELDISPQEIVEAYRVGKDASQEVAPEPATGKLPPKYRHPETGESWSGRGKTPRWLRAAEIAGIKREVFRVS